MQPTRPNADSRKASSACSTASQLRCQEKRVGLLARKLAIYSRGRQASPSRPPPVLARKVAAFPRWWVTGSVRRRLATTHPARRSRAYPPRLTKLDHIVNLQLGYRN